MQEMRDCTDELLDICDEIAVDAIGHSMSGLALLAYAIERPRRIKRLVLIGTGASGHAYMTAAGALWNNSHPHFRKMATLGILHVVWPCLGPERLLNNFIHCESFVDARLAQRAKISVGDWFRRKEGRSDWHRVARRLDYTAGLAQIATPTLIVCGRYDPQFPLQCSEELACHIKGAEQIVFERSGHYPCIEEPEAFWAAVATFLATRRTATRQANR
jgi:pimeloyl-ACP methyl ester carboxylesterase